MNVFSKFSLFSVKQVLAIAGIILASTAMMAVAPSTVLADSASDAYTEPDLPKPPPDKSSQGSVNSGNNSGKSAGTDSPAYQMDPTEPDYSGTDASPTSGSSGKKHASTKNQTSGKKSDKKKSKKGKDNSDDKAVAAFSGSGDGGSGGNGPAIVLVAVLLLAAFAGGGYYFWRSSQGGDNETRGKLQEAVNGGQSGPAEDS